MGKIHDPNIDGFCGILLKVDREFSRHLPFSWSSLRNYSPVFLTFGLLNFVFHKTFSSTHVYFPASFPCTKAGKAGIQHFINQPKFPINRDSSADLSYKTYYFNK